MIPALIAIAQDGDAVHTEETFRFLALPELWQLTLLIAPVVVLFAWWCYGGLRRLEASTRIVLACLRGAAIAILLLALFQPSIEEIRRATVRTQVQVLIDDSASMQRRDTYPDATQNEALTTLVGQPVAQLSRTELVAQVLGRPDGLWQRLAEKHDLRLFRFSREPRLIRDFDELTAKGRQSQLGVALDLLRGDAAAANLDAVVLVSDGRNNGGLSPVEIAQRYGDDDIPIYTVGVGDPNPPRNLRLVGPAGPKEALKNEEVAFDVTLSAEGLEGTSVTVTLSAAEADGGPYLPRATATAVLAEDGAPVKLRMYHAFSEPGDYTLRFSADPLPEETSHEDNVDTRFLRVEDQRIRVLYVEDLPRWEYRYVKNLLLRVDTTSIEAQVYQCDASRDFVHWSTEGLPPLRALPSTREELFAYDVILLGDVPKERLGRTEQERTAWLDLLVEFVELGGGVGFLFGENAMPHDYRRSALEDLLPVVLEDPAELATLVLDRRGSFTPQLELPHQPHEITLLRRDPEANALLWERKLAPWTTYFPVRKAKAGAEVLLRHPRDRNAYGNRVLAAASHYPRGRTFVLASDETWRWRKPYGERYMDPFWRNTVRYLAGGRLQHQDENVALTLDRVIVESGDQVRVRLELRDDELQPSRAPEAAVFLRRPEGGAEKRTLRPVPTEPGSFQGSFVLEEPGAVSVLVLGGDRPEGEVLAREDVLVKIPDRELAHSSQDRETLEAIARASKGGRYVFLAEADSLVDDFAKVVPFEREVDRKTRPLWDTWWTLLLVLAILAVEWTLRKRARLV